MDEKMIDGLYKYTYAEMFFAEDFAKKIVGNIDQRDFMDGRNQTRTGGKVFEDNVKGKLSEILVCNSIGGCELDFNIYDVGIGDSFDVVKNGLSIDVKASSNRARCLMVELRKARVWKKNGYPDWLCLVAVDQHTGRYLFGISMNDFMKKSNLFHRGDNIPNTNCKLKADNYIVTKNMCSDNISDMILFMNQPVN